MIEGRQAAAQRRTSELERSPPAAQNPQRGLASETTHTGGRAQMTAAMRQDHEPRKMMKASRVAEGAANSKPKPKTPR